MKRHNSILSAGDTTIAARLVEEHQSNKLKEEETVKFLTYIERTYEIENFPLSHYEFKVRRDKRPIPPYDCGDPYHAGNMYTILMHYLAYINRHDKNNIYFQKLIKYYEKQTRRMTSNKNVSLRFRGLEFLKRLIGIYAKTDEKKKFINTYRKSIALSSALKKPADDFSTVRFVYHQFFSKKLLDHIFEDSLEIFDKGLVLYGNNPKFIDCILDAMHFATDDEPCLILGETGTGKEAIAKIIHQQSDRKKNNFVVVNCGGFTESLFNSEISGIASGIATEVRAQLGVFLSVCNNRKGNGYYVENKMKTVGNKKVYYEEILFKIDGEVADPNEENLNKVRGTVFLDEVDSIPLDYQSKLLRIIQEKEVRLLGEYRNRKFKAKIICASNSDLIEKRQWDKFREDLYYRISRGVIKLPALREMKESIVDIAKLKITELSPVIGIDQSTSISRKAEKELEHYNWPGNIRELENVVYKALKKMEAEDSNVLEYRHLEELKSQPRKDSRFNYSGMTYSEVEKSYMEYVLLKNRGNILQASKEAGFPNRKPIYTWLKNNEINPDKYRNSN